MYRLYRPIGAVVGVGLVATAVSLATAWLLLQVLAGAAGFDGYVAGLLGGDLAGTVTASVAGMGVPVGGGALGVVGELAPLDLLLSGSWLALLAGAPLAGTATLVRLVVVVAPRCRVPAWAVLAGAAATYSLALGAAVLGVSRLTGRDWLVVQAPVVPAMAAALSWAGVLGAVVLLRRVRVPRRRGIAALTAPLLVLSLLTSGSPASAAEPDPVPSAYRRPGVAVAVEALRAASGGSFAVAEDLRRGTPSLVGLRAPLGGDVRSWLRRNAALFGVPDPAAVLRQVRDVRDDLGHRHLWFDQYAGAVPVHDARVGVHLAADGRTVRALSNGLRPDLSVGSAEATVSREAAVATARKALPGGRLVTAATLAFHAGSPVAGTPVPATLTWLVHLAAPAGTANLYFVDARRPQAIVAVEAKSYAGLDRRIWDAQGSTTGAVGVRSEGGPATGDADADAAYDLLGATYAYYRDTFGRDGIDGAGTALDAWVHFGTVANAFWDGTRMAFATGMVTPDITGHELTHGVTEHTAGLKYQNQSGALNESFSDIFGEMVERHHQGNHNWQIGEGSAVGILRDMADPPRRGDPGHLNDYDTDCRDNGGVHSNSGIPNRAAYQLAQGIGDEKAARIAYRNLTTYLKPDSGFNDARVGSITAATDLYGAGSREVSATADAWDTVGVDGVAEPPAKCTGGGCSISKAVDQGRDVLRDGGPKADDIIGGLLHVRDAMTAGTSPALDRYEGLYFAQNAALADVLAEDRGLRDRVVLVLQSLQPALQAVRTTAGDEVRVSQALIDEIDAFFDDVVRSAAEHGHPDLAATVTAERNRVNLRHLVGMTVNAALAHLDTVA